MVQTVRLPARKLARVGRPARWSSSIARTSVSRSALAPALARVDRDPGELALHLTDLPLVGALHPGQLGDAAGQPVEPLGERSGAGQPVGGGDQPVDVLGEPAGQLDPVAADVVERQRGAEPGLRVVGQRDAGEHAVEAEPPGVLEVADAEGLPVVGVEAPPDAGLAHPVGHRVEVVVDEAEAAPDRRALGEVEDGAGGRAAAGHVEQLGGDAEQRVGAGQRPVGELDAEPVGGVAALDDVTEAERRGDERRVVLDVGAHHEDVARLEARVVLEQAEQHLAEHLDLTGRPVAAVHLDRPVAVGEARDPAGGPCRRAGRSGASRAGCRGARLVATSTSVPWSAGPRLRWSSRWSRPSEASSGCRTRRWLSSGTTRRRARPGRRAAATGRRWGGAATGGGRGGWRARAAARSRWPACGCGRTARCAAAGRTGPRASRLEGRGVPLRRDRRPDRRGQCPPQRRLPARGRSSRSPPSPSLSRPADQSTSSCGRWAA